RLDAKIRRYGLERPPPLQGKVRGAPEIRPRSLVQGSDRARRAIHPPSRSLAQRDGLRARTAHLPALVRIAASLPFQLSPVPDARPLNMLPRGAERSITESFHRVTRSRV